MLQTIYGETLDKCVIKDRKSVEEFIEKEKKSYDKLINNSCLYSNKEVIKDNAVNYLNTTSKNNVDNQLKYILRKEFNECENIYPYLGDLFLSEYFEHTNIGNKLEYFKFHKDNIDDFIASLSNVHIIQIAKWFFDNCSVDHNVSIEKNYGNEIILKCSDDLNFMINYDKSFLMNRNSVKMKDYKFIIIDGYIESVGEIHHMLYKAANNKLPYVVFCFGMSKEVKHTIIENNKKGITNIMPVCIEFDENTINILNDIAILHNSDIVSSLKGETISQSVRKELSVGKSITFTNSGIIILPVCKKQKIDMHRKFLQKRINDSSHDTNKDIIYDRIKRFSTKNIKIYIPKVISKNNTFIRELDYLLRFYKHVGYSMLCYKNVINKKRYFVPKIFIDLLNDKVSGTKNTYKKLDKLILLGE